MKILALQGSPRAEGNTQALLEMVLDAATAAGAEAECIHLAGLDNLTGCGECQACQGRLDEPGCSIDDDMQPILAQAIAADVIVWATPVFIASPAWPLKMAMDRFFCMFKFVGDDVVKCLLEGRKMAAVVTAGGDEDEGADLVTEICRRLADFSRNEWLGALVAANVESAAGIRADADLIERARAFGRQLAS